MIAKLFTMQIAASTTIMTMMIFSKLSNAVLIVLFTSKSNSLKLNNFITGFFQSKWMRMKKIMIDPFCRSNWPRNFCVYCTVPRRGRADARICTEISPKFRPPRSWWSRWRRAKKKIHICRWTADPVNEKSRGGLGMRRAAVAEKHNIVYTS